MQAYWALVRRELSAHFLSWIGYVVMAVVLFLVGLSFLNLSEVLNAESTPVPLTELFYGTVYFWIIVLVVPPVITMRCFAQEKSSGTFETLMTAPVSEFQVVMAKFTGSILFYLVLWVPLLLCMYIVRHYSNEPSVVDFGTTASTYLGILLLGAVLTALGCFSSALTRSQIIAVIVAIALNFSLLLLSFLAMGFSGQAGWRAQFYAYFAVLEHMRDFVGGVVDTRPVVFYLSLTAFFLFLTHRIVESRRWK
jgi:ABC-2 type transport system permease protein